MASPTLAELQTYAKAHLGYNGSSRASFADSIATLYAAHGMTVPVNARNGVNIPAVLQEANLESMMNAWANPAQRAELEKAGNTIRQVQEAIGVKPREYAANDGQPFDNIPGINTISKLGEFYSKREAAIPVETGANGIQINWQQVLKDTQGHAQERVPESPAVTSVKVVPAPKTEAVVKQETPVQPVKTATTVEQPVIQPTEKKQDVQKTVESAPAPATAPQVVKPETKEQPAAPTQAAPAPSVLIKTRPAFHLPEVEAIKKDLAGIAIVPPHIEPAKQRGKVGQLINNVGNGIGDVAVDVGQGVGKAAVVTGKAIGHAGEEVGEFVGKGAKGAAKGVGKAAVVTGDAIGDAAEDVYDFAKKKLGKKNKENEPEEAKEEKKPKREPKPENPNHALLNEKGRTYDGMDKGAVGAKRYPLVRKLNEDGSPMLDKDGKQVLVRYDPLLQKELKERTTVAGQVLQDVSLRIGNLFGRGERNIGRLREVFVDADGDGKKDPGGYGRDQGEIVADKHKHKYQVLREDNILPEQKHILNQIGDGIKKLAPGGVKDVKEKSDAPQTPAEQETGQSKGKN